jgi:hypothetical protein
VTNVDRTARNTNMLMWHRRLHLIDHGAALYFHHSWENYLERSRDPFPLIRDHVLLPYASELAAVRETMLKNITPQVVRSIVADVPDALLTGDTKFATSAERRAAYEDYLLRRLEPPHAFLEEAIRARSVLV